MAKPPKDDLESSNEDEYDQETLEFLQAHRSPPERKEKLVRYFKANPISIHLGPRRQRPEEQPEE